MLRALFPEAVYMPRTRAVHAQIKIQSRTLHSTVQALIDSGATENFISPNVIDHYRIPVFKIPTPRIIRNVDGSKNSIGSITHACNLRIQHKGITEMHKFYVIDLGSDSMLLGMPFLAATNPDINWSEGKFGGKVVASTTDSHLWIPNQDKKVYKPFNTIPDRNLVVKRTTIATQLAAEAADKTERPWYQQVPKEYHQYGKVFSDKAAQRFPEKRPWDHAIDLLPTAPTHLNCKVYPLGESQQELLDKFLEEHLKKGYIRRSKSPYASPFFFVKKKDGKLRPVQDYRILNEYTVRNVYPIPLIQELCNKLLKKQWFTKFDIRWGYNNV